MPDTPPTEGLQSFLALLEDFTKSRQRDMANHMDWALADLSALLEYLENSEQDDMANFCDRGSSDLPALPGYLENSEQDDITDLLYPILTDKSSGDHVNGSGPHCNFDRPIMIFDVKHANKKDIEAKNRRNPSKRKTFEAMPDTPPTEGLQSFLALLEDFTKSRQRDMANHMDWALADLSALLEYLENSEQDDMANFCDRGSSDLPALPGYLENSEQDDITDLLYPILTDKSSGDHVNGSGPHCNFDRPIMIFDVKHANKKDIEAKNRHYYKMESKPRGRAVIINMMSFSEESGLTYRDGSSTDCTNASNLCEQLGFNVDMWTDLPRQDILDKVAVERVANHHWAADAFMLFILSHGNKGVFYAADGEKVNIDKEVIEQFNGYNCPQLIDKPKMFFIQACRGKRSTEGVVADSGSPLPRGETNGSTHEKADILEAWATVEGYESYRDMVMGSFFIRNLVKVFAQHAHDMHAEDMLTEVNRYVTNEGHSKRQVCQKTGTLNKSIFFFPGL